MSTPAQLRPPFIYYGGKQTLAATIAGLFPTHSHYVEPFAGSLSILLAKDRTKLETVNDLDGDLMLFFRVLRDRPDELARVCALTPHSRTERALARQRPDEIDELERARRVWVCLTQGRTGTLRNTGWRHDSSDHATISMPGRLSNYVARMESVAARLTQVSLECRPALDVIAAYGRNRHALLYVDPPYLGTVRMHNYRHEMTGPNEHRELAEALHGCTATVVVSGYAADLYDTELFAGWYRHELPAATSQGGTYQARTEVLWSNRPLHTGPDETDRDLFTTAEFRNTETANPAACNETQCAAADCQKVMHQPATGRRRTYCCTACRVRAHRQARAAS